MPGRLNPHFRSGNLSESLGIHLLKRIAAVATVERQEDVGFDAVASLLRQDSDGQLYAEDTFLVQLKTDSQESISYAPHATSWLQEQTLPMFIGLVSQTQQRLRLYSTAYLLQGLHSLGARSASVRFGNSPFPKFFAGYPNTPWCGRDQRDVVVYLGEPVAAWNMSDDPKAIYATLKQFLAVARRDMEMLSFGFWAALHWDTNDPASVLASYVAGNSDGADIADLGERVLPALHALLLRVGALPHENKVEFVSAVAMLMSSLRSIGVDDSRHAINVSLAFALRDVAS